MGAVLYAVLVVPLAAGSVPEGGGLLCKLDYPFLLLEGLFLGGAVLEASRVSPAAVGSLFLGVVA